MSFGYIDGNSGFVIHGRDGSEIKMDSDGNITISGNIKISDDTITVGSEKNIEIFIKDVIIYI